LRRDQIRRWDVPDARAGGEEVHITRSEAKTFGGRADGLRPNILAKCWKSRRGLVYGLRQELLWRT